jgi:hypothetical protein
LAGGLVAIDLTLTTIAYLAGELESGRAPSLDIWDLTKAVAIGIVLMVSAWRLRSVGLASFAIVFGLVGIADETNLHVTIAQGLNDLSPFEGLFDLHPTVTQGIWELVILLSISAAGLVLLLLLPGGGSWYPEVKRRLIALLVGLLFFAGVVDTIDHVTGIRGVWSLGEESGERLVLSLTLAYVVQIWWRIAHRSKGTDPAEQAGPT